MIEINGEYTTANVMGREEMFDESFFNQVQEIVDHEAFTNDIVIQPDGHAGAGAVIGFTMPVGDKVTPNVVGNDIGCGISAVNVGKPLVFEVDSEENWEEIDSRIRGEVPMGLGQTQSDPDYHIVNDFPWERCSEVRSQYDDGVEFDYGQDYLMDLCKRVGLDVNNVIASMGTLGSGNHFLEISQSTKTGDYWIVVHSGSRCVGGAVASYWQEKASENIEASQVLNNIEEWMWDYVKFEPDDYLDEIRQWIFGGMGESFYDMEKIREDFGGEVIEERRQQLKSLIPDTNRSKELDYIEGQSVDAYITDMVFAQQYARENRRVMLESVCELLGVEQSEYIDSIHNYIDFRDGVIRKGATGARNGEKLVIPFNMADGAVICEGKGNQSFNQSAPHGAGRRGSRRWAYRTFDVDQFDDLMNGVVNTNDSEEILDEIPTAYKDSEDIMEYLEETAEIEESIEPKLNMKGE
jgi:RNA-splicing ligase RtcB